MFRFASLSVILGVLLAIAGCDSGPKSAAGFRLPDGDPVEGQKIFVYMQCIQCHTVAGLELPTVPGEEPYVQLGGGVVRVKTYGELVTSIINPSHRLATGYAKELISEDGESNMYNYNQHMTIDELIHLVSFLQSHYDIVIPPVNSRIYPYR